MANTDVYNKVAEVIIARMESGLVPWRMPWVGGGLSKNLVTGKSYKGINTILLGSSGYSRPYFLTYKQALSLGGFVRKGEKSLPVLFWKWLTVEDSKGNSSTVPLIRLYSVFNVEQCEGLVHWRLTTPEPAREFTSIEGAEYVVASYKLGPTLVHGGDRAFYVPSADSVTMPKPEQFTSTESYYSTMFHELVHSTGHSKRLAREGVVNAVRYGAHEYAFEELVAEFGASFLRAVAGIERAPEVDNSAAYLASWVKRIRKEPRALVIACGQAQKAADFILGIEGDC